MPLGPDDRVEIPRRAPVRPGIAFARDANALPVARPGLDPHLEGLSFFDHARAVAPRPGRRILPRPGAARPRRQILARPMESGILQIKLHPPAGLVDLSRPAALWTFSRGFQKSL